MALKREYDNHFYSDAEDAAPEPTPKRQRKPTKQQQRQPAVDPTYGQKCAFPGLDGLISTSDDDLDFEDQTAALEYLRSVQQETSRIPHVVVAPKAGPQLPPDYVTTSINEEEDDLDRGIYYNGVGDSRGYYQDGAYTAAPYAENSDDEEQPLYDADDTDDTVQKQAALSEAYFDSLMTRFTALRARLHQDPPASAISALPPDHETEVESFGPNQRAFGQWTHRLRYTDPLAAQVAAMDKGSVLRLLRILLGGKFFRRGFALRQRTSRWIWALLARLPDRGELDSVEVGWVRDLGKRAVLVSISVEHVAALCEVIGRKELEAFGLRSVLHELQGRGLGEGADEVDDDGQLVEEVVPDVPRTQEENTQGPDAAVPRPPIDGMDSTAPQKEAVDVDIEDGELPEKDETASTLRREATNIDADDQGEKDMDVEDGEVLDDSPNAEDDHALAAAKARLLANLENAASLEQPSAPSPEADTDVHDEDPMNEGANTRATVNMILTVAGEFYGQRDLLAFRDPFGSVPLQTNLAELDSGE